jgi:hypothetical protein
MLALGLAWVLVSQIAVHHCTSGACAPAPDLLRTSVHELGRYATQERCLMIREEVERPWARLEADVDRELAPKPDRVAFVTTFLCERDESPAPPPEKETP